MLRFPQDVNTNQKVSRSILPSFISFKVSPHPHTDALPSPLVYSQNKITLSQQQPPIGTNLIHFKLVRFVSFAVVVRQECSTQNMPRMGHANSFSEFFSSQIKRQKDAISTNGLFYAHAQVGHVTHSGGRRITGLKVAPNFTSNCGIGWYPYRLFLSSRNVIHLCLHTHFSTLYWFFHVCNWRKPILEYVG